MSISEFAAVLKQLDGVKPPGVSGSRIRKMVELAIKNTPAYSEVVSALSDYARTSPASNKLGLLYAIDAIVRGYQEDARKQGMQGPSADAFAACQAALPEWMEQMRVRQQSVEQFDKMRKLLDIWKRAETVDAEVLNDWRNTYFKEPYTTTPPGSPPQLWASLPEDVPEAPLPPKKPAEAPNAEALFGMLQTLAKSKPADAKPESQTEAKSQAGATSQSSAAKPDPANVLQQLMSKSQPSSDDPRMAAMSQAPRGRDPVNKTATFDRNRSRSPERQESPEVAQPKTRAGDATRNLSREEELKPDRIKVYSRTLYVGAIPEKYTDTDLRETLETVAPVQSVILNRERHHAFVKLKSRHEAETVRDTFERQNREGASVLRIKWGVGYGPRDCFDYYRGVSVIPIMRLTDADRKWATSAEYGGTGGLALEAGMVMEEPDIEVGAGSLGSKNMQRQKMMQQQQMMMMPGMMPGMPLMAGMPGMPPMPGMMPMMPGMAPMPTGDGAQPDMSQFFQQMQQMQQMQPPQ